MAAEGWAAPDAVETQTIHEMETLNAPQHVIDACKQTRVIEILPMNWPIVVWFNDVCDLMRYRQDGACLGLDLIQVKTESDMSEREYTKKQFNGLRIMSKAAAIVINKIK